MEKNKRKTGPIMFALLLTMGNCRAETQDQLNLAAAKDARIAERESLFYYKRLWLKQHALCRYKFEQVQKVWLRYREMWCAYTESSYGDGSIAPLIYWECRARLTRERTAELKEELASYH